MRVSFFLLLVSVATIVSSTTCLVGAEKESVWIHRSGNIDKGAHGEKMVRYLRANKNEGDGEKEERGVFFPNRLKALFRVKSSTLNRGQMATKLSDTETKNLQKVASEIADTKFTAAEGKSLQKAVSYVAKGKLTQNDVKSIEKAVVVGWIPAVAYINRDEIYGSG
ncbi:putative secreted RxLR effector protein [Phytophthora cinnamomi]|uniref:putative secreted RxLR effector protein n=1 Tax=Phytophthora cinnamomi TaxID=4785 RepID=UPI00355982BE|nr:putative secreted RxLR effector protein [Phytophthora cinnamomi]